MLIIKIIGFALTALFITMLFKGRRDDIAVLVSIAFSIILFIFIVPKISMVISFMKTLANKANINFVYLNIVFKVLGIAYLSSFCAEICKDSGESIIAAKVEFAAKILILAMSIPILMAVLDSILKIM